jgi:hypothetical protein
VTWCGGRLVQGNPMTDKQVLMWNAFSWTFALVLAAIFLVGDLLGPYKGLYCCVKETRYKAYAVAPIIIVTFTAVVMMALCYYQAYEIIKAAESKRTSAAGQYRRKSVIPA